MSYVYRHIRPDTNEVFYVGVGEKEGVDYKRAHNKDNGRNKMWLGVVRKNPDYIVEIIMEGLTLQDAFKKEIEFIALYKRKMDGGTLVNITLGGDGIKGVPITEETRMKQSLAKKGKPAYNKGYNHTPEAKMKMSLAKKGKPGASKGRIVSEASKEKYKKSMEGKWKTGEDHHAFGKPIKPHVLEALLKNKPEKTWNEGRKYTQDELKKYFKNKIDAQKKPIMQFDNGLLVAQFHSATFASIATGLPHSSIAKCATGRMKSCGGYTWKYTSNYSLL